MDSARFLLKTKRAFGLDPFAKVTDCESLRQSVESCTEVAEMAWGTPYARRALAIAYAAQHRLEELGCE